MKVSSALLLVLVALVLAGCGGTSGPGSGGGSAETEVGTSGRPGEDSSAPGAKNDPTYIEAGNICVNLPIEQLAVQYGVDPDAQKVAAAVAADFPKADQEKAKAGCLAVLSEGGRGGG